MFYDRLTELLNENNVKFTPLSKSLDISAGSPTNWKKGTIPTGEILLKLANYFDVSVDYLLERTSDKRSHKSDMTEEEHTLIEKFRTIDAHGKKTIALLLESEYDRMKKQ